MTNLINQSPPAKTGRPAKRQKYSAPIAEAEDLIADKLPHLIKKTMELAEGVFAEKRQRGSGETVVYRTIPDIKALQFLIDRIMGKAAFEPAEVDAETAEDGPGSGPSICIYLPDNSR